jgi:hypothetical protein
VVQALGLERPVRFWAIDRLRWLYNDWTRLRRRGPELIVVGAEFYAALEDEMLTIARDTGLWFFVDGRLREPSLKFKGATVIARGRGYGIELRPVMEYAFNPA